jgi:hypothetical protein
MIRNPHRHLRRDIPSGTSSTELCKILPFSGDCLV